MRSLSATLLAALVAAPIALACPDPPPGYQQVDPHIPSGATCRGACGGGCPRTCEDFTLCVDDESSSGHCDYTGKRCGTHQGCREHDDCYDACGPRGVLDLGVWRCRRACDLGCIRRYGLAQCRSWMTGAGPYDGELSFTDPPVAGDGRCMPGADGGAGTDGGGAGTDGGTCLDVDGKYLCGDGCPCPPPYACMGPGTQCCYTPFPFGGQPLCLCPNQPNGLCP